MAQTPRLVGKGLQIVFSIEGDGWIGENYLDTSECGGVWYSMRPPKDEWFRKWESDRQARKGVSNWQFRGVGIAVGDLDKTAEYYTSLAIGKLGAEALFDSSSLSECSVDGNAPDTTIKARTRVARIGPINYEFHQPLEGETIYRSAMEKRGDGVNDIIFGVDDIEKETAALVRKGVRVALSGRYRDGQAFAYFDTCERGGEIMVRLIQDDAA